MSIHDHRGDFCVLCALIEEAARIEAERRP